MKKRVCALLAALLLALLPAPLALASSTMPYVLDLEGLLTQEEADQLEQQAASMARQYGCGVYIVTLHDFTAYGSGGVYEVTQALYLDGANGFGVGEGKEGILLLLSMSERDYALYAYGDLAEAAVNSYSIGRLEDAFLDDLGDNDWFGGFSDYQTACGQLLDRAAAGKPVGPSPVPYIAGSAAVSLVIALVVCLILKAQMKSVRRQTAANQYILGGGVKLTAQYDHFSHSTETRRRLESKSSGGTRGGGGGRGFGSSGKF